MMNPQPTRVVLVLVAGLLTSLAPASAQTPQTEPLAVFDRSDSGFLPQEEHEVTPVTDNSRRQGWSQHVDKVRFGRYTLSISRYLDLQGCHREDSVSIMGLSHSWECPKSISAAIRLDDMDKDLPDPLYEGSLMFCGLREVTNARMVTEVDWQDTAGGFMRARYIAWRDAPDRFGLTLRYFPPAGRTATSVVYRLFCQPQYSNRDAKRWMFTSARNEEVPAAPTTLDPAREWAVAYGNRYSLQTAGGTLAVDAAALTGATVQRDHAGAIITTLTLRNPTGSAACVLGDWVDENYAVAAPRYLASLDAVKRDLQRTAALTLAPPALPSKTAEADVDELLRTYPTFAERFSVAIAAARKELAESLAGYQDTPECFLRWHKSDEKLDGLVKDLFAEWIKQKLWTQGQGKPDGHD